MRIKTEYTNITDVIMGLLAVKIVFFLLFLSLSGCFQNNGNIVESTGTIEATQIDIRSEAGGQILKLNVDEGDRVNSGDILAEIDHEKMDYELINAQSNVKELGERLSLLQYGFRDEEVQKAKDFLLESEIQLNETKRDYNRTRKLFDDGVMSDHEMDKAETAYKSSLKRYEMAKKDYQIFQEGYRKEEISAAQAAKDSSEALEKLIIRRIKDATIKSPVKGVISERYIEFGEIISVGSILFTITDLNDCWIMAYVSEKNLGRVKLGQTGYVVIDSFPDKRFYGTVTYISQEAEFTPKNIQTKEERVKLVYGVKVKIKNDEELLKPGMPADVVLTVE